MQLLLAIVQAEDADVLVDRLIKKGIRVTRLNSLGSFLARGNATIFMGVENDQVEAVFEILRSTCRMRRAFSTRCRRWRRRTHRWPSSCRWK